MTTSGDSGEAEGRQVLDAADIARALRRMAGEIAERNNGVAGVALVGGIADGVASLGGGGGHGARRDEAEEESAPVEPEGAWLDFDALRVKPARDKAHRGRLIREGDGHARERDRARGEIESAAAPAGARDPLVTRGMFDHRYEVEGLAEVPADALGGAGLRVAELLRGEVERLDYKQKLFDDKASLAWRSTVYKPEMRWVVFAANDFLARAPYDKTTSRVREAIEYIETHAKGKK